MIGRHMSRLNNIFAFLAVFFFLFAPRLAIGGGVNTGVVVALCILVLAINARRKLTIPLPLLYVTAFFVIFALYSAIMAEFYGNNPLYFVNICISVIVSIVFSWFFSELLIKSNINGNELVFVIVKLMMWAVFVNSLIIILEYFFPQLKASIESLLYLDVTANINYADHPFRFRGLASAGGASLSIVIAIGILLTAFLFHIGKISGVLSILISLVMAVSNIFTGRTGLIFGLVFFFVLLLLVLKKSMASGMKGKIGAVVLIASFGLFVNYALNFKLDPEVASWAFEWVSGLTSGEVSSTSSDDLATMLFLPDNVWHLIFGIGFFEGDGSIYPRSDSGYVKSILTLGLIGSAMLYGLIVNMMLKLRKVDRVFIWLVGPILIFMLIVEIKEPFLYQNFAARVIFLLSGAALLLHGQQRDARNPYYRRT